MYITAVGTNCISERIFITNQNGYLCWLLLQFIMQQNKPQKRGKSAAYVENPPKNNGSAVYENLAYFSSKIEAPFVKYVNVFTFAWAIDFLSQASLGLSNLPNRA